MEPFYGFTREVDLAKNALRYNSFDIATGFVSGDDYVDAIRVWTDLLGGAASASIQIFVVLVEM